MKNSPISQTTSLDDLPLTERGYLLEMQKSILYNSQKSYHIPGDSVCLLTIAALFALYGAKITYLHGGYGGKIPRGKENFVDYQRIPEISLEFKDRPLLTYKDEVASYAKIIKHSGHAFWHPLHWLTEEGMLIQQSIRLQEKNLVTTKQYNHWKTENEKLGSLITAWGSTFLKKYKKTSNFKIVKFNNKHSFSITIEDTEIHAMKNISEIQKRHDDHLQLLKEFALYLSHGFLKKQKLFSKCIYE